MTMNEIRDDAGLVDVLDRVLDKGVVIDAHVRVAVAGIEVVAVEARVVVASFHTYLRHADTVAHTSLAARPTLPSATLPQIAPPPGLISAEALEDFADRRTAAETDDASPSGPAAAPDMT